MLTVKDVAQAVCGLSRSLTISVVCITLPVTSIFTLRVRKLCRSNLYSGQNGATAESLSCLCGFISVDAGGKLEAFTA